MTGWEQKAESKRRQKGRKQKAKVGGEHSPPLLPNSIALLLPRSLIQNPACSETLENSRTKNENPLPHSLFPILLFYCSFPLSGVQSKISYHYPVLPEKLIILILRNYEKFIQPLVFKQY